MLVDPHFIEQKERGIETVGSVLPSLGILSIASMLRKEHEVAVLDCQFHTYDSAAKEMRRFCPDLVALSATTPWIQPALIVTHVAKNMGALTVLGGPHPTVNPDYCLADSAVDAVVLGEAEETMVEFCRAVEQGRALSEIRGIAFQKNGRTARTTPRPVIPDLDALPMHAWDLVPVKRYMTSAVSRKSRESISLIASRGCPWNCSFCSKTVFGRRFRVRSPRLIIEEMRHLHERYGKRDFLFRDDVFTFPRKRIKGFCRLLIKERLDVEWCCETRADLVERNLIDLMKKAGCYQIGIGAESGNDGVLKRINKQITVSTIIKAVQLIKGAGLRSNASFIIGFPGETEREVLDTVRLATTLPLDHSIIQFFNPLPGAAIYDEAMRGGSQLGREKSSYIGRLRGIDYVPDTLNFEFLLSTYEHAYRQINWHPKRVIRYLWDIRSLDDINKAFGAAMQIRRIRKESDCVSSQEPEVLREA